METLHTTTLKSSIYQDALQIRKTVFVEEQGVPLDLEIDEYEDSCIHFVLYDQQKAVATCRLLVKSDDTMKLQRMAVDSRGRKSGYGRIIMTAAENYAREQNYQKIILGAQVSAIGFYEKLGFHQFGDEFLDAGIAHYMMEKKIFKVY